MFQLRKFHFLPNNLASVNHADFLMASPSCLPFFFKEINDVDPQVGARMLNRNYVDRVIVDGYGMINYRRGSICGLTNTKCNSQTKKRTPKRKMI